MYLWDALEAKNVSYRIYGEPYYLFTRMYRLITERFGADHALAKRFYAHSMALADSVDRATRFTALSTPFMGRATNRADALELLGDAQFSAGLSTLFTGDNSLTRAVSSDAAFRTGVADFLTHYTLGYPTWNLAFSDLDRAAIWRRDFEAAVRANQVPAFSYLWLPNDHTAGVNPSFLNPYQLVAQNDAALGQIVQAISSSPVWNESLIIVDGGRRPKRARSRRRHARSGAVDRSVGEARRRGTGSIRPAERTPHGGADPRPGSRCISATQSLRRCSTPSPRRLTRSRLCPSRHRPYLVPEDKARFDSLSARRP